MRSSCQVFDYIRRETARASIATAMKAMGANHGRVTDNPPFHYCLQLIEHLQLIS